MLKDPGVFDIAWVPGDLRHREEELQTLANTVPTTYMGMMPLRVIGPSGTGKTATVRYALEDLDHHIDDVVLPTPTRGIIAARGRRSTRSTPSSLSRPARSTPSLRYRTS